MFRPHGSYSNYLSLMGRTAEALAENKRAQEFDPLRIASKSIEGKILYFARRYDEAIQVFQNVNKLQPDYANAHAYLGYTYEAKGQYAEAITEYQKQININGETPGSLCFMGYAYARSGKRDEAATKKPPSTRSNAPTKSTTSRCNISNLTRTTTPSTPKRGSRT